MSQEEGNRSETMQAMDVDSVETAQASSNYTVRLAKTIPKRKKIENGPKKCICNVYSDKETTRFPPQWNTLRKEQRLFDGKIRSNDGIVFNVHRAIVAAECPFFMAAFSNSLLENTTGSREVEVPLDSGAVEAIINYSYTGECDVKSSNVQELLPAADMLGVQAIVTKCRKFLLEHMNPENCVGILRISKHDAEMNRKAREYFCRHFKRILEVSSEFIDMSSDDLLSFVSHDELCVDEIMVFRAIIKWVEHDLTNRWRYLRDLLGGLRFCSMSPNCMATIMGNEHVRNIQFAPQVRPEETPQIPLDIVIVLGGWNSRMPQDKIESYDPRSDNWCRLSVNLPTLNGYFGACVMDNIIYIAGGCSLHGNFKNLYSYDPEKNKWTELACMYEERCYVSVCTLYGKIYAIGGFNTDAKLSSAERYDLEKNQWEMIPSMHRQRSDANVAVLNNKIYVVGGYTGKVVLQNAEVFNPITEIWTLLVQELSTPRSGLGVVALNGSIYALGGFDGHRRTKLVECLNVHQKEKGWQRRKEMQLARSNFGCAVFEGMIYVFGGFNGMHSISDVERYDPETDTWEKVQGMKTPRSASRACVLFGLPNRKDYIQRGKFVNPN